MFSFEFGFFCFARRVAVALMDFFDLPTLACRRLSEPNKLLAGRVGKYYNAVRLSCLFSKPLTMRSTILAGSLIAMLCAEGAYAGVVVEKRSRQVPDTAVLDCAGVHSFVFRGPTGTSRRPIMVPPREYWTAQESGLYSFVLRYRSGNVCSRMVTPEVFARYQVGDDFNDLAPRDQYESDDSKTIQPVVRHHDRHRTAQLRRRSHSRGLHRAALAKHYRHHRSHRLAAH
jgi:hypothetical protein